MTFKMTRLCLVYLSPHFVTAFTKVDLHIKHVSQKFRLQTALRVTMLQAVFSKHRSSAHLALQGTKFSE